MNRNAALKLPRLFLFAFACFACATFAGAQQAQDLIPAGMAPAAGATPSSLYSLDSSGPDRDSMSGAANRTGSKAFNSAGSINSRSTWMAGANTTSSAGASMWNASQSNFSGASASSWSAGARSFSLGRQQGGLWQESPGTEAQSQTRIANMPVTSAGSNGSFSLSALTPKGAALINGAGLAARYASHSKNSLGIRTVANPFAAQRGIGNVKNQFGFKTGGFGSLGNGIGSKPSTLGRPSTGTLNGPATDDTLPLDEGLGSEKRTLGLDELDSTGETSR